MIASLATEWRRSCRRTSPRPASLRTRRQVTLRLCELLAGARADDAAVASGCPWRRRSRAAGEHLVGDDHVALAGLRVGEAQHALTPVDLRPGQVQDLVAAHAGEREQADRPGRLGVEVAGLAGGVFSQAAARLEVLALLGGQEALDGVLAEAADGREDDPA
jgi:hypothetical protein